ncbi:MAG: hypothetical protein A2745_03460 [Candidatus Harrisonbacteria bacterium RIFCSPHIGHO2_01_FULL_44_13]|nr:MAG: hypothetical protein A2745_03460 [Candidatus Harrisonbacteria bacterium RIFCSPHIGHO2_01_FULL_44_13]
MRKGGGQAMKDPYKTVIPRLTLDEIRGLVRSLPEPHEKISLGKREQLNFEVYLVKKMHNRQWENRVLLKLLLHARGSFYVYSELPPLDSYDLKSQIYLVRIRYNVKIANSCYPVEEWVSTRFIPYYGDPEKFRDIEMFEYRGRGIESQIEKRLLDVAKLDWGSVVGASGLCGIEPFSASENIVSQESLAMRYTSLAFALIVAQFIKSCEGCPPAYLAAQVAEEFVQGVLSFRAQNQVFRPNFTLASDLLMIKNASQVKLRRNNRLIYNRPLYFFNRKALLELLRDLIRKEVLTAKTFEYYMGDSALAKRLLNSERVAASEFAKLGRIFTASGMLYGAKITGAKLRNILKRVPDGPKFRIMKLSEFILSLRKMISAADSL